MILTVEGLAWLEWYLDADGPLPTAWAVHLYYAKSGDEAARRIDAWYEFMAKENVVLPTIITETNAHNAALPQQLDVLNRLTDIMIESDWLKSVFWFSIYYLTKDPTSKNNDLLTREQAYGAPPTGDGIRPAAADLPPLAQKFRAVQGLAF